MRILSNDGSTAVEFDMTDISGGEVDQTNGNYVCANPIGLCGNDEPFELARYGEFGRRNGVDVEGCRKLVRQLTSLNGYADIMYVRLPEHYVEPLIVVTPDGEYEYRNYLKTPHPFRNLKDKMRIITSTGEWSVAYYWGTLNGTDILQVACTEMSGTQYHCLGEYDSATEIKFVEQIIKIGYYDDVIYLAMPASSDEPIMVHAVSGTFTASEYLSMKKQNKKDEQVEKDEQVKKDEQVEKDEQNEQDEMDEMGELDNQEW